MDAAIAFIIGLFVGGIFTTFTFCLILAGEGKENEDSR